MGSVHKAHLLRAEPGRVVPRTHMQLFGSWPHCFMGNRLEGMTGRQTTVYLDLDTGGCFWKWPKWGCRFKENNWWYLLPMTKFSKQTWEKNENFWKLAYPFPHDLDSFWEVKDFSDEIGGDINEGEFLKLFNEMCELSEDQHNSANQYYTMTSLPCSKIPTKHKSINAF